MFEPALFDHVAQARLAAILNAVGALILLPLAAGALVLGTNATEGGEDGPLLAGCLLGAAYLMVPWLAIYLPALFVSRWLTGRGRSKAACVLAGLPLASALLLIGLLTALR